MNSDAMLAVVNHLLSLQTIVALMAGVLGGMLVGALPGLTATMGVALLIPVTFGMDPVAGLTMLTAIYTAGVYGGSISAILIHTPGSPASAATTLDGYQLTLQGRGLKALGVSTVSSVIGGLFSAVALLVLAPPLSVISLKFNAPEFFLLAIFGLTIIGGLTSGSVLKGLTSGVFGLTVGLFGTDLTTAFPRFTFGIDSLESGISLIPAMIGLFSISQVMTLSEKIGVKEDITIPELTGSFLPSWQEFKTIFPTIIRSSFIGLFVGILPGAGGDIGAWVGYNEAKRFSKKPEEFGKGSLEGVAGPEAANNAVCGGALIPMLTLGIPGSALTAVLLGGLMIKGLLPGRELFTKYADITYAVMIGFFIANIVMGIVGFLGAKYFVKVAKTPTAVLTPIIVVLSAVGSYAITNNVFDVFIMVVFGFIGYVMRKFDFHPAPVVLAIVLGPLIEDGFKRSLVLSKGDLISYFFGRPICIGLIVLIVLSIITPILLNRRKASAAQTGAAGDSFQQAD